MEENGLPKIAAPVIRPECTTASGVEAVNYIIAIGIDKYGEPMKDHNFDNVCKKDCEDVVKCLLSSYKDFVLYKQLIDEQATKAAIEQTINDFIFDEDKNCSPH
ncbi:MAG TPA: hypothetical protein VHZ50_11015, partial [Puia sp.]|nr:hypothetical protein [Puia sp.]